MIQLRRLLVVALGLCASTLSAALWSGTTGDPQGWKYSDWFGWFWSPSEDAGWLYHETLGWLYAEGTDQSAIDFYAADLEWLYSGDGTYPVFYGYTLEEWYNYAYADDAGNPYWWIYDQDVFATRSTLGFLTQTNALLASAWAGNFTDQRTYFWEFWAYLTATTDGVPFFESYFTRDEIFDADGGDADNDYDTPNQHDDSVSGAGSITSLLFNEAATDFIRRNAFNYQQTFLDLSAQFTQDNTPPADRTISFPAASIGLKPLWFPILNRASAQARVLPIWDGEPQYPVTAQTPDAANPPLPTDSLLGFKRAVVVSVTGDPVPDSTTATIDWNGVADYQAEVVPLADFYYQLVTEANLAEAQAAVDDSYPTLAGELRPGDFLLLVGMHILPEAEEAGKVLATYWWHPEPDTGPYSGGRPPSVTGVFRNYVMNTIFESSQTPEYDGSPFIIFNPYLEAAEAGGAASNCFTCHSFAGLNKFPPSPDPRTEAPDDEFANSVGFDGWWSLAFETIPAE